MRKYRNKLLLMIAFVFMFAFVLAATAFCIEEESITISFESALGISDAFDDITSTSGKQIELPKGEAPKGYSYVWVTSDGKAYMGGTKVIFYDSMKLKPMYAYDVETDEEFRSFCNNFDDSELAKLTPNELNVTPDIQRYITVRLLDDIALTRALQIKTSLGSYLNIILNGHTLTVGKALNGALGGECFGTRLYGSGTLKYEGTGAIFRLDSSDGGEGKPSGEKNELLIGANVYVNAPKAVLAKDSAEAVTTGYPQVRIYGTVDCKTVLQIEKSVNRKPVINIYPRSFLTLNGGLVDGNDNAFTITISGGTIVAKSTEISFFSAIANTTPSTFNIVGGSFKFAKDSDDLTLGNLVNSSYVKHYKISYDDVKYSTVFPSSCAVRHTYEKNKEYPPTYSHAKEIIFKCSTCERLEYLSVGAVGGQHSFDEEQATINKAKPTERGEIINRCNLCGCEDYTFLYYNPLDDEIQVVVLVDGKSSTVSGKVKDIFDIDEKTFYIKGLKDFDKYTATQVIEIIVTPGIKGLNFASENSTLKKIVLSDGLEVEIVSVAKLTALQTIEIGAVSYAKFSKNCAPDSLKSIVVKAEGAKIVFSDEAFNGKVNLETLTLTNNSEYSFGTSSFKGTGIKKLHLLDGTKVIFTGTGAFTGSAIEELYIGKGVKKLDSKQFDSTAQLKKLMLMEVTSIADGDFSNNATGSLVIYHHASTLTLGAKTFENSNGLTIYTKAEITTGFGEGCCETFTIIKGITHAYDEDYKEPTCTEDGYRNFVTDCLCGVNEGAKTTVYKNVLTNSETKEEGANYTNQKYPKIAHPFKSNPVIQYFDGYTKNGSYAKECEVCKIVVPDMDKPSCAPLIKSLGFSVSEERSGAGAMVVKYVFNTDVIKDFSESKTIEFGTVFAVRDMLGDKTPLEATSGVRKLSGSADGKMYASFTMKIANITEAQENISFIMAAYIVENGKATYIQDNELVTNPSGVTYKEVKLLSGY